MRWADLPLRFKLLGTFAVSLGAVLVLAGLAYRTTVASRDAAALVAHTLEVIRLADEAQSGLVDAETGYRGFLLTGRDEFLATYDQGLATARARLAQLEQTTADNPPQVARWQALAAQADAWQQTVTEPGIAQRRAVDRGQDTLGSIAAAVASGAGKQRFDAMRALIAQAIATEEDLLAERTQAADAANGSLQMILVAGSLIIALLGLATALLLARAVAEPAARLARSAHRLAGGDLAERVHLRPPRGDEIGRAAQAFDDMADRLQQTIQTLDREARLLDLAQDAILVRSVGRAEITYWNQGAVRLYGWSAAEAIGRVSHDLLQTAFPEPRASIERTLAEQGVWQGDLVHTARDGRRLVVASRWAVQRDQDGTPLAYLELNTDVTERRHLEARLEQRTSELEEANRELVAFTYSVAHDLRAPLRAIDGFSLALLEDYGATLDPGAQDYLHDVRAATQRLGQLMDDLLQLARVSRAPLRRERVDLSGLAQAVARELDATTPDRRIAWQIQPGLLGNGDPSLLRLVLDNLLGNAHKFTAACPVARITFTGTAVGGAASEQVYTVSDNGAGFDPTYAAKLFGPFQRLHREDEFPGTGIGLATVARVVARHGGRVEAHSPGEGHGAAFSFTLPSATPDPAT